MIDFKDSNKKDISFSYIMHLFEEFKRFEIQNNSIYLNGRLWELSDTIVAVYECKRKRGSKLYGKVI